jgi:hypothetical protein
MSGNGCQEKNYQWNLPQRWVTLSLYYDEHGRDGENGMHRVLGDSPWRQAFWQRDVREDAMAADAPDAVANLDDGQFFPGAVIGIPNVIV